MNKIYNLLLAVFAAFAIISCSDDNSNDTSANNSPLAKYVDNAMTAKKYSFEGDVKMVEISQYSDASIDTITGKINEGEYSKFIYYFDHNGALIKSVIFDNYSDYNPISTPDNEITYTYDSLYRDIEIKSYAYKEDRYYIRKTEYNDTEKTATVISYSQDKKMSNITDLTTKDVYKLDDKGMIDPDDVDSYYSDFYYDPQYIALQSASIKNVEADITTKYSHKVERDSKKISLWNIG